LIGHLSADELASYRAGLLSDSRAAKISAHLSECGRCTGLAADLAGVSVLLASVQAPAMPQRLSERLQAAIATESANRASGLTPAAGDLMDGTAVRQPVPVGVPGRPDLPERTTSQRRRPRFPDWSSPLLLRGLAATGAVVLVVGGGLLLANSGGGRPSSTAAGTRPQAGSTRRLTPGAVRPLGTPDSTPVQYRHGGRYLYANTLSSTMNYTKADLAAGVRQEVANVPAIYPGPTPGAAASNTPGVNSGPEETPATRVGWIRIHRLTGCLTAAAAGRQILLAEVAHYGGSPATIIVLRPVHGVLPVIVVGAACTGSSADVITRLSVPSK
jgi:hypothetical protein